MGPRIRSTDDPADQPYKQRQIPIHVHQSLPLPFNGLVAKVQFLLVLAKNAGFAGLAFALLVLVLAAVFGYISIPIVDKVVVKMLANDAEIIITLNTIKADMAADRARRERILAIIIRTMQVNCENAAKDAFQRSNCQNIHD